MTHDVPPCPHCGRLPSPSGCFKTYDFRGIPLEPDAPPPETVPLLVFCCETCSEDFWNKIAEELKVKRLAGR